MPAAIVYDYQANLNIIKYIEKFRTESDLISRYSEQKAFIVWSMGLYLDIQDLESLADENLTDMGDDHGIDFLRFDEEEGTLLIVQSYYTKKITLAAPAGKAADLNASCAWLLNGEIEHFNPAIQQHIADARNEVISNKVQKIILVYLHDCGESVEVSREMNTVKDNLVALLGDRPIEVLSFQMGNESLERMYQNQAANIIVTDKVVCPFPIKFYEQSDDWKAAILSVSGQWLRDRYLQYSGDLFSANYRGFLGNSRQKINNGIKATAEKCSKNFWAFNNGITIITNKIEKDANGNTVLTGFSIINGAQTTGSLGAVPVTTNLSGVMILTRIIECSNVDTIGDIVKFNNTQNKITAWDSFSNDPIQNQLQEHFAVCKYSYNIKRGFSNRDSLLSVESSIQPLLALSGKYKDAIRSKTYIFDSKALYTEAFEQRGARNVLFACCLNSCLQLIKSENKTLVENGTAGDSEKALHNILAVIKFKYYLLSIIAKSLHKLSTSLVDSRRISFMPNYANADSYSYDDLVDVLKPIVKMLLPSIVNALGSDFYSKYNDSASVENVARIVETNVSSMKGISNDVKMAVESIGNILCNG